MNRQWIAVAFSMALFTVLQSSAAHAASDAQDEDIGTAVRGVFKAKCAVCHGPDLAKPKGRFGYVLDLPRIASNPEMVIPGEPKESELWQRITHDEMPPEESPQGPLTAGQKETIRKWIEAGAPDVAGEKETQAPAPPPPTLMTRMIAWVGKFHILTLHLPIALVLAAGIAEGWSMWRGNKSPSEVVRFCLWLAALTVIQTASTGWLFAAAGNGLGSPRLLMAHRWLGTATAVFIIVTALLVERDARRYSRSWLVRATLGWAIIIMTVTAHLGGLLAWGVDFFDF